MAFRQYEVKVYDGSGGTVARTEWKNGGVYHRDDGPAVEFATGEKHWYNEGCLHRDNGPAVEHPNGYQEWCKHGKRHRMDGPAVISPEGEHQYYIDGKMMNKNEWEWIVNEEIKNRTKEIDAFKEKVHDLTSSLDGKIAEIEGKKYKLQLME